MTPSDRHLRGEPVESSGDSVLLNPTTMEVDRPYPFRFSSGWYVAVRRRDGTLDTYSTAEDRAPAGRLRRWLRPIRFRFSTRSRYG